MEPLSPTLLQAIQSLQIVSASDLRRASARCRSLAIDLPTFDSVWIDAFVSLRLITMFQARHLDEGKPDALRFGSYLLVDQLSQRPEGSTFLARKIGEKSLSVLKTIAIEPGAEETFRKRFDNLTSRAAKIDSRRVVIPHSLTTVHDHKIGLVSRFAGTINARQELVRCGRLHAENVVRIGHQLIYSLNEIHSSGIIHGDIRLEKVRLSSRGDAVLVDAGLQELFTRYKSIHRSNRQEAVEGRTSGTIGVHSRSDSASDIYCLGCVLWQLLAGRPPFAGGDSLALLVAHLSKPLPDVRNFAPDTPKNLAEAIQQMTQLDPADRPSDLMKLAATMQCKSGNYAAARHRGIRGRKSLTPILSSLCVTLVFCVVAVCFFQLAPAGRLRAVSSTSVDTAIAAEPTAVKTDSGLFQLPDPDSNGIIYLEHPGPYAAADIQFQGTLTIRGSESRRVEIIIGDRPLRLWAQEILFENISVIQDGSKVATGPPALLLVEAQSFSARSCRFEGEANANVRRSSAVGWRTTDRADPTAGVLSFKNCVCRSLREFVYCADAPRILSIENALVVGSSRLAMIKVSGASTHVSFNRLTVRDADSLLAVSSGGESGKLDAVSRDCIFETASLHLPTEAPVNWRGSDVVISRANGLVLPTEAPREKLDPAIADTALATYPSGFLPGKVTFKDHSLESDDASEARVSGVPRRAGVVIGVDLSQLPAEAVK